jgi:mRNA-degrading endonuclease toxin of MazEF toxin-antitoxin module
MAAGQERKISLRRFDDTASITIVPLTSDRVEAMFRVPVEPDTANGLQVTSRLMADQSNDD